MRNTISLLRDVRLEQIRQAHVAEGLPVPASVMQETRDAYRFIDDNLTMTVARGTAQGKMMEAMTTGDFPYALGEFVQRRMLPAYQRKAFNFEPLVWMDTTPNFLPVTRYQNRAGLDDLEYVGPKGNPRPGSYDDAIKREYQVHDWMKLFDFDRHALVNDDLGYFDEAAQLMGQAARRTVEKFVSRMYNNVTSIARLVALGALYSQNGRITTTRISEARMAFNQRLDNRGEPILAALRYIVYPSGLKDTVFTILRTTVLPNLAPNIVENSFVPIEDPYIVATAPNFPWWAFVDYNLNNIKPLVLARLAGVPAPVVVRRISSQEVVSSLDGAGRSVPATMGDFLTGNVAFKVHDIWGTYVDDTEGNFMDVNGAYYSSGTVA